MLVDQVSSADIIFIDAFSKIGIPMEEVGSFHRALEAFAEEQV